MSATTTDILDAADHVEDALSAINDQRAATLDALHGLTQRRPMPAVTDRQLNALDALAVGLSRIADQLATLRRQAEGELR